MDRQITRVSRLNIYINLSYLFEAMDLWNVIFNL